MKMACIVGTGPAGLMAAEVLSHYQIKVVVLEARRSPGWKILVAGSSGLNVTYDSPPENFFLHYGKRAEEMKHCLSSFPPTQWLSYLRELGMEPFLGTSKRYFIQGMKGSPLLRAWMKRLHANGVEFSYGETLTNFETGTNDLVSIQTNQIRSADALLFALGGGSWLKSPATWPVIFRNKGIEVEPFQPANAGFVLRAPNVFFQEAEGKPIKGLTLKTSLGQKQGELMITKYGLEGSPVYWVGTIGSAFLDLKPDLSLEKIREKLSSSKKPIERTLKYDLKLSEGALLLIKHLANAPIDAEAIKNFPIYLESPRSLDESISSSGGVCWKELNPDMELRKLPRVFCAGEMLDWSAPTGGFLFQGCVSTGYQAGLGIANSLNLEKKPY